MSAEFDRYARDYDNLPQRLFEFAGKLERFLAGVPLGGQYAVFGEKSRPFAGS